MCFAPFNPSPARIFTWTRGRYADGEIQNLLDANHLRAQLVLDKLREYLPDPYGSGGFDRKSVRALGFCAGIEHAGFMARFIGPGRFLDAEGDRPIAIRWQLENPVPLAHYREARRVCGLEE